MILTTYKKTKQTKTNMTLHKSNHAFIPDTPPITLYQYCKRTSLIAQKKYKSSLTVEAALVLPVFLFALISLLYFSFIIQYTNCVYQGLHQTAKDLAIKSYALSATNSNISSSKAAGIALSETYVRGNVNNYLKSVQLSSGKVNYLRSNLEGDVLDIIAEETITLPYSFLGVTNFNILERARIHTWTGYSGNESIKHSNTDEEIVYITSHGSVYHKNRNCYHLKVTPRPADPASIDNMRNSEGAKYYPCEYCKNQNSSVLYVTDYGNRYHTKINCGAISRDIKAVKLSDVGSRRPCQTCG